MGPHDCQRQTSLTDELVGVVGDFAVRVNEGRQRLADIHTTAAPKLTDSTAGEIAGLRWANVNLKAKTVTIAENRVAIGRQIVSGTPKSKASTRTLPMPAEVVEALRAARKRQAEERLAFGAGYGSDHYVASDETGQPYHPNLLTFR